MRIQPHMKSQLQFRISIRGRQYSRNFIVEREDTTASEGTAQEFGNSVFIKRYFTVRKREDTTSDEDTSSIFCNSVFGRHHSTVRKREDTTSGPLDNSVDCSETNVTVMPNITGECNSVVEAICSVVLITVKKSIRLV